MSVTPDKSALAQAREMLELRVFEAEECVRVGLTKHLQQDWRDLRLVLDALAEAERVADAGKRLATGEYIDWSSAGGPNECQHGVADRIPCAHCDRLTVNNWSDSQ